MAALGRALVVGSTRNKKGERRRAGWAKQQSTVQHTGGGCRGGRERWSAARHGGRAVVADPRNKNKVRRSEKEKQKKEKRNEREEGRRRRRSKQRGAYRRRAVIDRRLEHGVKEERKTTVRVCCT